MARMFGTDGVRGVAGSELTIELATKLGQAGAYVLTKETEHQATIIVGCDTRISGGMLASALMAGICSVGANAIFVGVMPTPAIAYLTRKHKVDAGVVISASHNPMEFHVFILQIKAVFDLSHPGSDRKYHVFHVVAYQRFNLILQCIGKLVALAVEELDSVKFHRIVRCRDHNTAEMGTSDNTDT